MVETLDALEIYQRHLDIVSRAFWLEEWDELIRHMRLPGHTRLRDADIEVTTPEQAVAMHKELRICYRRIGASDYCRIGYQAAFTDKAQTKIVGRHRTHVVRSGCYVLPVYDCEMKVQLHDEVWQACGINCSVSNKDVNIIGAVANLQDHLAQA
ncbi:MAG: hypothetical protein AAGA70_14525 [Pseudomonadota bacterium]